jgi:hypothetical protein
MSAIKLPTPEPSQTWSYKLYTRVLHTRLLQPRYLGPRARLQVTAASLFSLKSVVSFFCLGLFRRCPRTMYLSASPAAQWPRLSVRERPYLSMWQCSPSGESICRPSSVPFIGEAEYTSLAAFQFVMPSQACGSSSTQYQARLSASLAAFCVSKALPKFVYGSAHHQVILSARLDAFCIREALPKHVTVLTIRRV